INQKIKSTSTSSSRNSSPPCQTHLLRAKLHIFRLTAISQSIIVTVESSPSNRHRRVFTVESSGPICKCE
ncbi:hypothetical protein LINPERHAP1_LOCUS5034, partial [Linum perenne]